MNRLNVKIVDAFFVRQPVAANLLINFGCFALFCVNLHYFALPKGPCRTKIATA